MFAFSIGDFTEWNIKLNIGLIFLLKSWLQNPSIIICPVCQKTKGPCYYISTSHPLIKYIHKKSILTFPTSGWAVQDQNRNRVCFVFCFPWKRREESLVPSKMGQVRATEHAKPVIWFYSAHPGQHTEYGYWGDETMVWGLSFSLRVFWACLFILRSTNQHIQAPTMCQALRGGWLTF